MGGRDLKPEFFLKFGNSLRTSDLEREGLRQKREMRTKVIKELLVKEENPSSIKSLKEKRN